MEEARSVFMSSIGVEMDTWRMTFQIMVAKRGWMTERSMLSCAKIDSRVPQITYLPARNSFVFMITCGDPSC